MPEQQPSVGRIVHYVSYGTPGGEYVSQCRAAIVTEVDDPEPGAGEGWAVRPRVGLCVMNPTGHFFNQHVPYGDVHGGGTWHWPERV
jgi:hypothetical protein